MSGLDVAALRAVAEAATPGPWAHSTVLRGHVYRRGSDVLVGNPRDADYAAAANPSVVLALLDRLEVAEAAVVQQERDIMTLQEYADAETARANTAEAAMEQVRALADEGVDEPHLDHGGGNGENVLFCPRCWADGITAALDQSALTTPGGDA